MDVVVLVRHPAGFASSLKHWGMSHRWGDFLQQRRLMCERLSDFADEVGDHVAHKRPILEQAVLLWRMIYSTVDQYQRDHPDWIIARQEDLARAPCEAFSDLYARLGLEMSPAIGGRILRHSQADVRPTDNMGVRRDSLRAALSWRERLSEDEVRTIRSAVAGVSDRFYGENEW
jgi:hypothetical protein